MRKQRKIGEVFIFPSLGREYIKVDEGVTIPYAVYVAKHNPDICGEWFEGCEVHHKDGDALNNEPYNLVCLTPEEHHKMHKEYPTFYKMQKVRGTYNGKVIGTFRSKADAFRKTGCPAGVITYYCMHKKPLSEEYSDWVWECI